MKMTSQELKSKVYMGHICLKNGKKQTWQKLETINKTFEVSETVLDNQHKGTEAQTRVFMILSEVK